MNAILHAVQTLASFALVLGVLVSIHELGHYFAARWCGIGVEAFSIGFGPALKSWTDRRGTVWKISMLPLGGYVKMHGMSPTARADAAEAGEQYRAEEAFAEKHVGKRAFVAFAGPLANFLLTIVLYTGLLMAVGRQVPLPVVGDVQPGSAAARAGLLAGDRITAVDGEAIDKFTSLQRIISAAPGRDIKISVVRGAQSLVLPVHVTADASSGTPRGKLGVISGQNAFEHLGPGEAAVEGVTQTWAIGSQIVYNITQLVTGRQSAEALGGVISIADLSGKMARQGSARADLLHRHPVGQSGPGEPAAHPGAGWGTFNVLRGRSGARPAGRATGAGIWLPSRHRADRLRVRLCLVERPGARGRVALGDAPPGVAIRRSGYQASVRQAAPW